MINLFQTPAVLLGWFGAYLTVSKNSRRRFLGYSSWIAGNALWLLSGIETGNFNLIAQFGFFLAMAMKGAFQNSKFRTDKHDE